MNANVATELRATARRSGRAVVVRLLGPLTMAGAVAWALFQPYRLTLLHPHGQGFWWLAVEPPLLAFAAGLVFQLLVAPGVLADLEDAEG
jgi:hypothetical protein